MRLVRSWSRRACLQQFPRLVSRAWNWRHGSAKLHTLVRERFRQILAVGSVVATTTASLTIVTSAQAAAGETVASYSLSTTAASATPSGVSVSARRSFSWSAPVNTNMGLVSISCVSASFCVGLSFGGAAYTYHGGSWSGPLRAVNTEGTDVSCASETFCAAGNVTGEVAIYNGRSWSSARKVSPQGTISLSCPSTSFCMSMGNGYFATFDGKTWSRPRRFDLSFVSCASASFCVAVGGGQSVVFDGATWSARESDHLSSVQSISCPSAPFCMAVSAGATAIYDGKSWSTLPVADAYEVSCASRAFCVTVTPMGEADTYNGTIWSAPLDLDPRSGQHIFGRGAAGRLVPIVEVLHGCGRVRLYYRTSDPRLNTSQPSRSRARRSGLAGQPREAPRGAVGGS